ncbi:MAG: hypothetical protein R3296_01520 [Oleiphilaceae bacterium]|nr:hypothetical protein [Oleiphilaceae bacterium]
MKQGGQERPETRHQPQLPRELPELLRELEACGHHGVRVLERTGLPFWGRPQLFRLMGFVAKADGRVTELDIQYAQSLMRSMALSTRQRRRMIRRFQQGKDLDRPKNPLWLRWLTPRWPGTALRLALALGHLCHQEGPASPARVSRAQSALNQMGLPPAAARRILTSYQGKVWITRPSVGVVPPVSGYSHACDVLGGQPSDSLLSLRQNYRRLRGRYHPDRAQHLPASEQQQARQKLEQLQKAWEIVCHRHPDAEQPRRSRR